MPESITFWSNKELTCPVCETKFKREDMLTGRGRLNAGKLTDELHRLYIPTQKYGEVFPLIYPITVCPNCLYAVFKEDFTKAPEKIQSKLLDYQSVRAKYLIKIFGKVPDFLSEREFVSGTASYILAISSYSFFDKKKFSPTVKKGICALRVAWMMTDLQEQTKDTRFGELSNLFYKQAAIWYDEALEAQSKGKEPLDYCNWLGPDADVNFGYNGYLYVVGILKYKMAAFIEDPYKKLKVFEEVKRILSKVFGSGRKAKDIPQDLLNLSREFYEKIGNELKEMEAMLGEVEQTEEPVEEEAAEDVEVEE